MKGRKPKYSNELIAELAARVSAGESPSALAKEKSMSRSSVRRCAESARLPTESKEQNLEAATQVGTARQREKLFWAFVTVYLHQGIALAPKSTPRDVAGMIEAAVKLRSLMPPSRSSPRLPERQKASETLLIFQRSLSQVVESANVVEVAEVPPKSLSEANRTASKTASEEGGIADQAPQSEGNDATR
ncbi:MAG: hypothetical protein HY549_09625 [Elusimicrobia bacterium]|nr:hypothetical protein [Elusimicrobiota bacterium]